MKKLLIVIDMQNDFIDMALGTQEAVAIVPKVKARIKEAVKQGEDIVFTMDTHQADYLQTQEGCRLPVEHCIKGTKGWEIHPELDLFACQSKVFEKPTFGSLELAKYVADNQYTHATLIGLCTDICVISNAMVLRAHQPELQLSVDASCCAGVTPASHLNALEAMKMCQVEIITETLKAAAEERADSIETPQEELDENEISQPGSSKIPLHERIDSEA